jgi:dUTP pyrophosphatase
MVVRIKKLHKDAVIPKYAQEGDAGMDLTSISLKQDDNGNYVYGTGLSFEIPEGYVGFLFPRSSNSKTAQVLTNSVGVIDSGYRGEVFLKFKPSMVYPSDKNVVNRYNIGDRVGQLIILPYPKIEFEEVEELSDTDRGTGGFGSTGS